MPYECLCKWRKLAIWNYHCKHPSNTAGFGKCNDIIEMGNCPMGFVSKEYAEKYYEEIE